MDAGPSPEPRAPPLTHAEITSVFSGLMLAMFLSALDSTIVATALPTIGREFGDVVHLPWIVTAYLLASTAVTPLYGKLADMHGRRPIMLIGIALFMAGSVACALAPSLLALALARAVQGLGGGGLIALAQTIVGDMVSPRERGRYQVYFGIVFASASVLGPVLGGLFSDALHWSWIFWINLPLGLLTLWLVSDKLKRLPRHERLHRLDYLGAALMIAATTTLLLALTWGGSEHPWLSPTILALFGASFLLWGAFVVRLLSAAEPLIPLPVLGDQVVATATLASALTMGIYVGMVVTVPVFFETSRGLSARESGLALVAFMLGVPIGATVAGRSMASVTHYKRLPLVGMAVAIVTLAIFAAVAPTAPFWQIEALLGLAAIGLGTVLPVTTVSIQNAVAAHHLGTATATMNFTRQLSSAVSVAVFGAVALGGGSLAEGARRAGPLDRSGFPTAFWIAAAGLAVAWVALASMRERPLRDRGAPSSSSPD